MECYYQLENDNIHLEIRDEILHERKYKKKKKKSTWRYHPISSALQAGSFVYKVVTKTLHQGRSTRHLSPSQK